ncbi:MOSC domain-containing protein [Anaerobacillus sp. CMMVII]|uniref:MOSC domain-containing protein n=1 Tax=Anaerobacillus sp. CMMVII TaxID=2755588 RepID=UPI0021B700C5|nr:MOSC domain-containing protein [Anaerobacillus sp. CMMVII]MCT8138564.1 MOSC domain-containing protein [Anaerobacillus sp. CMMVII]
MLKINSINIGKSQTIVHNGKKIISSICKTIVNEPLKLGELGFEGDEQADLVHHGGSDKAVCVYSMEHYQYWEKILSRKLDYGAFGENVTVTGMTEIDVCIGDLFQIGEAVVQVSQPRQPCYKLAARYNVPEMVALVQNSGYTGFYFRVIKEGVIDVSSKITLVEKSSQGISIEFANQMMYHDNRNNEGIKKLLEVEALSASWRQTLMKR